MKTIDLQAENAALKTELAELKSLVKFYEEQFRLAKHRQFGASSEKGEYPDQLSLFDEAEITADADIPEPELVEIEKHYRKRKRLTSKKLPDDLPVETIEYELPENEQICPECGDALRSIGHDTRRELAVIPAQVKIVEHVQSVYACRNCEQSSDHVPIVKPPMPEPVIKKSMASPSIVAHIMAQKYVMHVPLYRQEQEFKRVGIMLSRQTMANWVIRCSEDWLEPIYERLKKLLLARNVLHADETRVQVLHEPGKRPQSGSYMWLYRTSGDTKEHIVLFEYSSLAIKPLSQ